MSKEKVISLDKTNKPEGKRKFEDLEMQVAEIHILSELLVDAMTEQMPDHNNKRDYLINLINEKAIKLEADYLSCF